MPLTRVIDLIGRNTHLDEFLPSLAASLQTVANFDVLGVVVPHDAPETSDFISPPPCRSPAAAPGFILLRNKRIQLRSEHMRAGYRSCPQVTGTTRVRRAPQFAADVFTCARAHRCYA